MRDRTLIPVFLALTLAVSGSGLAMAGPVDRDLPHRYQPRSLDGRPVSTIDTVSGDVVAAWAYRNGPGYDLAVAVRQGDNSWSEPLFIGLDDGRDQRRPAIVSDDHGNVYLAWISGDDGRVQMMTRTSAAGTWGPIEQVASAGRRVQSIAIKIVGDRLVVASANPHTVRITDLALAGVPVNGTQGISDGPDPIDSNGDESEEGEDGSEHAPTGDDSDDGIGPIQSKRGSNRR